MWTARRWDSPIRCPTNLCRAAFRLDLEKIRIHARISSNDYNRNSLDLLSYPVAPCRMFSPSLLSLRFIPSQRQLCCGTRRDPGPAATPGGEGHDKPAEVDYSSTQNGGASSALAGAAASFQALSASAHGSISAASFAAFTGNSSSHSGGGGGMSFALNSPPGGGGAMGSSSSPTLSLPGALQKGAPIARWWHMIVLFETEAMCQHAAEHVNKRHEALRSRRLNAVKGALRGLAPDLPLSSPSSPNESAPVASSSSDAAARGAPPPETTVPLPSSLRQPRSDDHTC